MSITVFKDGVLHYKLTIQLAEARQAWNVFLESNELAIC